MPKGFRIIARAMLAISLAVTLAFPAFANDPAVKLTDSDPEMNAAIQDARRTLDNFLTLHASGQIDPKDAAVRVAVPTTEGLCCEHIWMVEFTREGEVFSGLVANDPIDVNYLKLWQPYQFTRADISDWNYRADGKLHGAYTLRVMIPKLPPEQAAEFRAILAPLP